MTLMNCCSYYPRCGCDAKKEISRLRAENDELGYKIHNLIDERDKWKRKAEAYREICVFFEFDPSIKPTVENLFTQVDQEAQRILEGEPGK